jgi:hypothetical protein
VKSAQSFVSAGPEGVGTHLNGGAGFQPAGSSGVPAASSETAGRDARTTRTQDACATFQTFHVNGSMPTVRRERAGIFSTANLARRKFVARHGQNIL